MSGSRHQIFAQWWGFACTIGLVGFMGHHFGMLTTLVNADPSRLSIAILGVFVLALVHGGWHAYRLSREATACQEVIKKLLELGMEDATARENWLNLESVPVSECRRQIELRLGALNVSGFAGTAVFGRSSTHRRTDENLHAILEERLHGPHAGHPGGERGRSPSMSPGRTLPCPPSPAPALPA